MRCVIYLRVSAKEQAERDDTEEGYSLPAQRDACLQFIREQGWSCIDEYVDRGESASKRSADRPQFSQMLRRIRDQGDVDAVIVHKLDRFSRDAALHLMVRATLRKQGVALISVTEKIEETASGRLVEGIQALVNEYHSANLATEVKKGMRKKAELGGAPFRAPLGYVNRREWIEGRRVSYVEVDADRAGLIKKAFQLYATGEYTLEALAEELRVRGLMTRGRRGTPPRPIPVGGLGHILGNKFYIGTVEWNGIESPGRHEPLIDPQTFHKVQAILESRSVRDVRNRRHHHPLKGLLFCGVCKRRMSLQVAKGQLYFFCLGRRDARKPSDCREPFVLAEKLDADMEALWEKVQLPADMAVELIDGMEQELVGREDRNAAERDFQTRRLARLEQKRRKIIDAYYAGAVDIAMLKSEQQTIDREVTQINDRLKVVDAKLEQWRRILNKARAFVPHCALGYRKGNPRVRQQFATTVFAQLSVRGGRIADHEFTPFFAALYGANEGLNNEIWYPVSDSNR